MKTEADLCKYLTEQFNLQADLGFYKTADKVNIGVADYLLWKAPKKAGAMEVKFIKDFPTDKSNLLKHPFIGPQYTFLETISLTRNPAVGIIGVDSLKRIYIIPFSRLPKEGNWNTGLFKKTDYVYFDYKAIDMMIDWMLGL